MVTVLFAASAIAFGLMLVVRTLGRARPNLHLGHPLAVGLGVRLGAIALASIPSLSSLRGPDERLYLDAAHELSHYSLLSDRSLETFRLGDPLGSSLHTWLSSRLIDLFGFGDTSLRVVQAGIGVIAIALLAAAVHDIVGKRPAAFTAWFLALEPSGVFFSGIVHKESLTLLGIALVVFGGVRLWRRPDGPAFAALVAAAVISVLTRPSQGWGIVAAGTAIVTYAWISRVRSKAWRRFLVVGALIAAVAGILVIAYSPLGEAQLAKLQESQEFISEEGGVGNLPLEPVDFSTPLNVARYLPQRIRDLLLRPYPWQLDNRSQVLGAPVTLLSTLLLVALLVFLLRSLGRVMHRSGPIAFTFVAVALPYALVTANAGQAFRYRVHLVALMACWLAMLAWDSRNPLVEIQRNGDEG